MLRLDNHQALENTALTSPVAQTARQELDTLLALSGGETIDNEYGHVLVLMESDPPEEVEALLRRPIEGAVRRYNCTVLYLAGGGNEHLIAAVLPDHLLKAEHKKRLLELTQGDQT